jgi:hypothetical protein
MDIKKLMAKIDNFATEKAKQDEQKRIEELREENRLKTEIQILKPNIENLIKIFRYAIEAKVFFPKGMLSFSDKLDEIDLLADSYRHQLGFVKFRTTPTDTDVEIDDLLAICGGGCNGNYDFITDGDYIADRNRDTLHDKPASIEHMRNFLKKFPEFEKKVIELIERKTEIKVLKKNLYYIEVCDCNGDRVFESRWFDSIEEAEKWWEHTTLTTGDYNASLLVARNLSEETNDYDVDFLKYLQ